MRISEHGTSNTTSTVHIGNAMDSALNIIPALLPEEILRSYVIRTHLINVHASVKNTLKALFGTYMTDLTVNFPGNLGYLSDILSNGSVNQTIIQHTLLPIYQPFYDPNRYIQAKGKLETNKITGLSAQLGKLKSRMHQPAVCPACVSEDQIRHGFSYWHLNHQLALIECCPKHQLELLTYCHTCSHPLMASNDWHLPQLECIHCGQTLPKIRWTADDQSQAFLIRLAKFAYDALRGQIPHVDERKRWAIYKQKALKLKLNCRNNIWQQLSLQLLQQYASQKLKYLELSLNSGNSQGWMGLANLGVAYSNDPTVNLLMLTLLFQSTKDYIATVDQFNGPVHGKSYEGVLFFKKENGITFGLLRDLVLSDMDILQLSRRHKVDIDVINLLIKKHPKLSASRKKYKRLKLGHQYRLKIASEFEQGHVHCLQDLKFINEKIFTWMQCHDLEWLENFILKHNIIDTRKNTSAEIIEIQYIDRKLMETITQICEEEYRKTDHPQRITKHRLYEYIGYENKKRIKGGKLPVTQKVIELHAENYQAFILRYLLSAVLTLMKEDIPINQETIQKKTNFSPRNMKRLSPLIEELVYFLN